MNGPSFQTIYSQLPQVLDLENSLEYLRALLPHPPKLASISLMTFRTGYGSFSWYH